MDFHPIANVWPLMQEEELKALSQDIKQNGQLNPIWLYQGKILDGRNRYTACVMAGTKPLTKDYTGEEPAAFAVSLNDKRRHMNKGQLGAVAVELLPFFEAEAKKRQKAAGGDKVSERAKAVDKKIYQAVDNPRSPQAIDEAAKQVGTNRQYVSDAKKIKEAAPEVFETLKAGKITMQNAKREVAKKPTDDWRKDERERQEKVESGLAVVANQNADKNLILWAERTGKAVRIDRSSKYGNPFILGPDGDRDEVCDWFENNYLPLKRSIKEDLPKLKGKVLICHCYPQRCHGDCLAKNANKTRGN